jgi:hypothetical protein
MSGGENGAKDLIKAPVNMGVDVLPPDQSNYILQPADIGGGDQNTPPRF